MVYKLRVTEDKGCNVYSQPYFFANHCLHIRKWIDNNLDK